MSIALSIPASVPVDLLPASAHRLRWDVGEVLRWLVARAAVEQAIDHPTHSPTRQLGVLPHTLRRRFAGSAVALQQCVAAPIALRHPEAP